MADVEVKFDGATIGSLTAAGSMTLQTGGKYCDDNITINYTPSGGIVKSKTWYVTVPTTLNSGTTTLVQNDADVAAHYTDSKATLVLVTNGIFRLGGKGIDLQCRQNTVMTQFVDNTYGVSVGHATANSMSARASTVQLSNLSSVPFEDQTGKKFGVRVTSSGSIIYDATADEGMLYFGDYKIIMSWE